MSEPPPFKKPKPAAPASLPSGSESPLEDPASPVLRIDALRLELAAAKLEQEIAAIRPGPSPEVQFQNRVATPPDLRDAAHAVRLEKLRREAADLKAVPQARWWHSWGSVAGVTALVTATVPITTGVLSYFSNQRTVDMERAKNEHDLALKDQQQKHQIATEKIRLSDEIGRAYLNLAQDAKERARVLRFVRSTASILDLRTWANEELGVVQLEIDQLKQELADAKMKALPHRCLKWEFEAITGDLPQSMGPVACAAWNSKNMPFKMGDTEGEFYVKDVDKWIKTESPSAHTIDCKCVKSQPEAKAPILPAAAK